MGLETATYISGLVASNPIDVTDVVGQGDDHLRLVKSTLLNTFPNITGAMTKTHTELNNAAIKSDATNTFLSTLLEQASGSNTSIDNTLRNSVGGLQHRLVATSGSARIGQTNASGTYEKTWLLLARDGAVSIYNNDNIAIQTNASGVDVRHPTSTAPDIGLRDNSNALLGQVGVSGTTLRMRNRIDGAQISLTANDAGGVERTLFNADPDGAAKLYYLGNAVLDSQSGGIVVRPQGGSANGEVQVDDSGAESLSIFKVSSGDALFRNNEISGVVRLQGKNSVDTLTNLLTAEPDGAVINYFNGETALLTQTNGITVIGRAVTDQSEIELNGIAGQLGALLYTGGVMYMQSVINSDTISIRGKTSAGANSNVFTGDPNADSKLYYNGAEQFRTQSAGGSHNTSGAEVADHGGTFRDVGWNVMPLETISASMTLDEADVGKHVQKNGGSTATLVTLPSGSSGAVPPIGATTIISNIDTETMTIAAAGTLRWLDGSDGAAPEGTRTLARSGVCTVYKASSLIWYIWGSGLS